MRLALAIDEHIGGLQITVQNAMLVSVVDCLTDGCQVSSGLARRQWSLSDKPGEGCALDVFHAEERLAVDFADLVDGDYIGMAFQARGRLRFGAEARQVRFGG